MPFHAFLPSTFPWRFLSFVRCKFQGARHVLLADLCSERAALRAALMNRLTVLCFGAGADSTAIVALRLAGLEPDAITFADTEGEKPPTLAHITRVEHVLRAWSWHRANCVRAIEKAKRRPRAREVGLLL